MLFFLPTSPFSMFIDSQSSEVKKKTFRVFKNRYCLQHIVRYEYECHCVSGVTERVHLKVINDK